MARRAVMPGYRLRLLGVYDAETGKPLEGVQVTDVLNRNSSKTSPTGTVSLMFLPEGGSLVRIGKLGYEMQSLMVAIGPADTTPVTVLLNRTTDLPAVVATADSAAPRYASTMLQGFEERRKAGIGHFISDRELRASESQAIGAVLRSKLPGISVDDNPRAIKVFSNTPLSRCQASIFIDGAHVTAGFPVPTDVSLYAGVEYYTGTEVPQQYAHTSNCDAVLLLWTRER